jgi:hypothetical protein
MKTLFLFFSFLSFISLSRAQKQMSQYKCELSYKHHETRFKLTLGEVKEVDVGGWKIFAGIKKETGIVEVSLSRKVNVMDATYHREAKKNYPLKARTLPVVLEHSFGGHTDVFNMICYQLRP